MNPDEIAAIVATLDKMVSENIAADVVAIEETTRSSIQEQISNGLRANMTANQIAQAVDDIFGGFTSERSLTIARTEIGTASSMGQFAAAATAGMKFKVWHTSLDENVRHAHEHMNGEKVALFEKFSNGGLFPLDSNLSAGERINCRCSMTFEME